jgi:DHA2 family multidrug resistance protein
MTVQSTIRSAEPQVGIRTFVGFTVMCLGMFMAILDIQIVATSLPTIQEALGIEQDQMSWVQTAYLIAEVVAIPLTGFLIGLLGLRRLFVAAILVFSVASLGCAASTGFATLIAWRVVQGFSGGMLIPVVFAAVFLFFPVRMQSLATTIAGVLAVLAPTVGPVAGGWITETYSWHWLFLINVVPGLLAGLCGFGLLPRAGMDRSMLKRFDLVSLLLLATCLAALEIALKEAPHRGWLSPVVVSLLCWTTAGGAVFVHRAVRAGQPLVDMRLFADRDFALASVLSFVLGIGLYGSVYLMPVFLAYVRGHGALEIGRIMLVTGVAQLVTAPIAVALEKRIDARLLTAFGFALFALGLGLSARQTMETDFDEMFWPQVLRGVAIMFCLLPPTRLALGRIAPERVPDASALFNLMRNLGGAIGLALIDTVIYGLSASRGAAILARLEAGDAATAEAIGLPASILDAGPEALEDPVIQMIFGTLIDTAAFVETTNLAWGLVAILSLAAIATLPFITGSTMPEGEPTAPGSRRAG